MRFRVLGPLEVADQKRRLMIGSAYQRVVLAVLLAARGEVVSPDRLVDTHADIHVAVALDQLGGMLGAIEIPRPTAMRTARCT